MTSVSWTPSEEDNTKSNLQWECDHYDVTFQKTLVKNGITYWQIEFENKLYWVIKRFIPNLQPIVTYWIKILFGLNMLPAIRTKYRGRMYLLYKVDDPEEQHLLSDYPKNETPTDSVVKQAKNIYAFRKIMLLHCKTDSDILFRKENYDRVLYSFVEVPTNKPLITQNLIRKWFKEYPIDNFIKKKIEKMANGQPTSEISRLAYGIDHFEKHLTKVAEMNDITLLSYTSDVITQLINLTL
jgi:hypothetical protein